MDHGSSCMMNMEERLLALAGNGKQGLAGMLAIVEMALCNTIDFQFVAYQIMQIEQHLQSLCVYLELMFLQLDKAR